MVLVIVRNVDMRIVFRACFGGFSLLPYFLVYFLFLIPLIYLAIQNLYLLAFIYLHGKELLHNYCCFKAFFDSDFISKSCSDV